MFADMFFRLFVVMIANIDVSREILAIDRLTVTFKILFETVTNTFCDHKDYSKISQFQAQMVLTNRDIFQIQG